MIIMIMDNFGEGLENSLIENKKEMLKIMQEAPIVGVYLGEKPEQWDNFYQFYMNFLQMEIGPRGQCTKAVRSILAQQPQYFDQILSIINCNHNNCIRDIYIKYKLFSPSQNYDKIIKLQESLLKANDSFARIMDDQSVMYSKIREGMIAKRGEDYDYKQEIQNIRNNYKQKLQLMREDEKILQQKLDNCAEYIRYIKMKQVMREYFRMWKEADQRVGIQSVGKGDAFENVVSEKLIPLILRKGGVNVKQKQVKVMKNCNWIPKNLGQIDIAVAVYNNELDKWEVTILVECKSRLFDIREAYKQVGVLKQKNKLLLGTELGKIEICDSPQYFIVTTLPENPYNLPIESKMKESLEKGTKNKSISEMESKELFAAVSEKFKDQLSPLDWFLQNDSDRIIVLKY